MKRVNIKFSDLLGCFHYILNAPQRVRNIISKGPKYRFPSNIDFPKCPLEITASLNDFSNRLYKRKNVEPDALKEWKINIFKIIDICISFYSRNTHILPPLTRIFFSSS